MIAYGPFAAGVVLGAGVAAIAFYLAGKERRDRHKIDLDREKQLLKQISDKEKRIDELHYKVQLLQDGKPLKDPKK